MRNLTKKIKGITILTLIFIFITGNADFSYAKEKSGWNHLSLWTEALMTALGGSIVKGCVKALDYGKVGQMIYNEGYKNFIRAATANKTAFEDPTGVGWAMWGITNILGSFPGAGSSAAAVIGLGYGYYRNGVPLPEPDLPPPPTPVPPNKPGGDHPDDFEGIIETDKENLFNSFRSGFLNYSYSYIAGLIEDPNCTHEVELFYNKVKQVNPDYLKHIELLKSKADETGTIASQIQEKVCLLYYGTITPTTEFPHFKSEEDVINFLNTLTPQDKLKFNKLHQEYANKLSEFDKVCETLQEDFKKAVDCITFENGYFENARELVNKLEIPNWFTEIDDAPAGKVLIIPSGGFFGMDTSEILKYEFRKYVSEGGILISFAQQQGYEFSCLPGGEVKGYGWGEDQSCWTNAAYVDTYKPCFAGQDSGNLDVNVDGYFTQWPASATVLLRRTKNNMPCMLMYPYGKGWVIASTLYSDWGYGHNHTSNVEIKLIRDLISWAKDLNKEIPEFKPGAPINLNVAVTNNTDEYANKVILTLIDPDRNIIATQTIITSIPPHQTTKIPYSPFPIPSSLGIWWIDYELQDNAGNTIQPQTEGERFAVSRHLTGSTQLEGYKIWAVADEQVAVGSNVVYTIFVRNDTDNDLVNGNIGIGVHEQGGRYWAHIGTITGVNVPAHSQTSFLYEREVSLSTSSYFGLYLGTPFNTWFFGGAVAINEKGVLVIEPAVDIQIITNKKEYSKGDNVNIELNLKNKTEVNYEFSTNLRIFNPDNAVIFATTTTLNLTPNGSVSLDYNFSLPLDAIDGIYIIQAEAKSNNQMVGLNTTAFKILEGILGLEVSLPETFIPNSTSTFSFTLNNLGLTVIESNTITVFFIDPNKTLLYDKTFITGSVAIGGFVTQDIKIPINGIEFGVYELFYTLNYEGKTLAGSKKIKCDVIIKVDLDKPSYRVRDELKSVIEIINTGKFRQDGQVVSFIDGLNFSTSTMLSLLPNEKRSVSLSNFIPATLSSGYHYGTVSLILGSSTTNKQFSFYIPEAKLKLDMPKTSYSTSEDITFSIVNEGGVDAGYDGVVKIVDSNFRNCKEEGTNTTIEAGKSAEVSIDIPSQLVTGDYNLLVSGTQTGGKSEALQSRVDFQKLIHIQGISAEMELSSDKLNYLPGETITATALLKNVGLGNIEDGTLTFKVFKNISKISNEVVEFGFDNNGVINYAGFVAGAPGSGENLLDEAKIAIRLEGKVIWVEEWTPVSRYYDDNYYEVVSKYVIDENRTLFLTCRYKLANETKKYLDAQYEVRLVGSESLYDVRLFTFLDSKVKNGYGSEENAESSQWQSVKDTASNWKDGEPWLSEESCFLSVGEEVKLGERAKSMVGNLVRSQSGFRKTIIPTGGIIPGGDYYVGSAQEAKNEINTGWLTMPPPFPIFTISDAEAIARQFDFGVLNPDTPSYLVDKRIEVAGESNPLVSNPGIIFVDELSIPLLSNKETKTTSIKLPEYLTGKLYLVGSLYSKTNQLITQKTSSFYINSLQPLNLNLEVEKEYYKPGEIINATFTVNCGTETAMDNLWLEVLLGTQTTIFNSGTFSLEAYGNRTFSISSIATTSGILNAKVMQGTNSLVSVYEQVKVVEPELEVAIETKEVVGRGSESMRITLKNTGNIPIVASGKWRVASEEWEELGTISVVGGQTKVIETNYRLSITDYRPGYATITLSLTGDVHTVTTKQVEFGEQVDLAVKPDLVYPVGYLEVPFEVVNRGKMDSEFGATFTILATTEGKSEIRNPKSEIQGENNPLTPFTKGEFLPAWCKAMPRIEVRTQSTEHRTQNTESRNERLKPKFQAKTPVPNPDAIILAGEFYIPAGGTITGSLVFDLGTGNYSLSYDYFRGTGSNNFRVAMENIAKISGFRVQGSGFGVEIGVANLGSNEFNGELSFQTAFYQTRTAVSLGVGKGATYTIATNERLKSELQLPGTYTAKAVILYDGNELDRKEMGFELEPRFEVSRLDGLRFKVGEDGTITVELKNVGNAVGEAKVKVKLLDLVDEERGIWLEPQEVGSLSYRLQVPADFEDGSYSLVASGKWQGASGEILGTETIGLVRIVGIKIKVEAGLDKEAYTEGETATLTLKVINLSDAELGTLNLSAKVKFNGYEGTITFSLLPSPFSLLPFNFPIRHTGQKLNFGIYSQDDRAIWLDAIYVREAGTLTIIADKQVYEQGETVILTVMMEESGTVSLTTPGEPATVTLVFNGVGSQTVGFKLPAQMLTGTYYVNVSEESYTYNSTNYQYPFEVIGYELKVLEGKLNKYRFLPEDRIEIKLRVKASIDMQSTIKGWVCNPGLEYEKVFEEERALYQGENTLNLTATFSTQYADIHRLVYGFYYHASPDVLLASGSENFDVGEIFFESLSLYKTSYRIYEPIVVNIKVYGTGTANLNILVDDNIIYDGTITNGTAYHQYQVEIQTPGTHTISAIIKEEGLISKKDMVVFVRPAEITLLSPISGAAGTIVTVEGGGYKTTETISIGFGETLNIAVTTANLFGSFSTTFIADLQPYGTKTITATGIESNQSAVAVFRLNKKPTILTLYDTETLYKGTTTFKVYLLDDTGTSVSDRIVIFIIGTTTIGTASTKPDGMATLEYLCLLPKGTYSTTAEFEGDDYYLGSYATATLKVKERTLPDLVVSNLSFAPAPPTELSRQVSIKALITNQGNAPAGTITVSFYDGQIKIDDDKVIHQIKPGQTKPTVMLWRASLPLGTHTIRVVVDPYNRIEESNEGNNEGSSSISVILPPNRGVIAGTVTNKQTNGPIEGALVTAWGKDFGIACTDKDGKYIISNLRPGKYTMLVFKCGYGPEFRNTKVVTGKITYEDFALIKWLWKKATSPVEDEKVEFETLLAMFTLAWEGKTQEKAPSQISNINFESLMAATLVWNWGKLESEKWEVESEKREVERGSSTVVRLSPEVFNVSPTQEFDIEVIADNVEDLMGANIKLGFEPKLFEVVSINKGELLSRNKGKVNLFTTIDNIYGIIEMATSLIDGSPMGVTGSGVIASIRFRAKSSGSSNIKWLECDPRNKFNASMETTTQDASISNNYQDLTKAYCYPNPSRIGKITFADLPLNIKIRIFNLAGEEVYEYEGVSNGGKWTWMLQNKVNEKVTSGIYIYVISAEGEKKVGKIGVVK